MIVVIAGMQRSGSTFSFNVTRQLLAKHGSIYQQASPSVISALEQSGGARHVLVKSHDVDATTLLLIKASGVKTICTVRRPEDAIASWMQTFGFDLEHGLEVMKAWLLMYEKIKDQALIINYEQIDRHRFSAVQRIANYIRPESGFFERAAISRSLSKEKVKSAVDKLTQDGPETTDLGFSFYDSNTFFHRRHVVDLISVSAEQRIGNDAVRAIRKSLGDYLGVDGSLL